MLNNDKVLFLPSSAAEIINQSCQDFTDIPLTIPAKREESLSVMGGLYQIHSQKFNRLQKLWRVSCSYRGHVAEGSTFDSILKRRQDNQKQFVCHLRTLIYARAWSSHAMPAPALLKEMSLVTAEQFSVQDKKKDKNEQN